MAAGMAAVGGVTSYATGGNFGQGALLGAAGGYGMVKGIGMGAKYGAKNFAKGTMTGDASRKATAFMIGANGGSGSGVANRRGAMLAGSALSGMVFGGNRRSHKRGFNSRRGNGF